jgi:ABC-2 type transport system permease protein
MHVWTLIKNDLKILLRDRGELISLFLLPLAFILPVSFALGGGDGYGLTSGNHRMLLPLANLDGGPLSVQLIKTLSESLTVEDHFNAGQIQALNLQNNPDCLHTGPVCDEQVVHELINHSARDVALVIPAGFSNAVQTGHKTALILLYDPVQDAARRQQVEGVVQGAALSLSLNAQLTRGIGQLQGLSTLAPDSLRSQFEQQVQPNQEANQPPAVQLQQMEPSNYTLPQLPNTYQQTVPGYTVMYVFFIIGYLASAIRSEKLNGTFKRLLSLPVSRWQLVAGKLGAGLTIGVLQVAIMFAIGALLFHLDLGRDPFALALLTITLVASANAIGLAASTTRLRGGVLTAPLIVSALLGGCMFPIDLMPRFMRVLSLAMPHSWALNGYMNLMVRGQGLVQVLPQIGVLLVFTAVFFFIAVRRFRFED